MVVLVQVLSCWVDLTKGDSLQVDLCQVQLTEGVLSTVDLPSVADLSKVDLPSVASPERGDSLRVDLLLVADL